MHIYREMYKSVWPETNKQKNPKIFASMKCIIMSKKNRVEDNVEL